MSVCQGQRDLSLLGHAIKFTRKNSSRFLVAWSPILLPERFGSFFFQYNVAELCV